MSINNQRMKWWEKYRNKDVNQEASRNTADLRDLARAALLRILHSKVDAVDIDVMLDSIMGTVKDNYSEVEIMRYILRYTHESNKRMENYHD